MPRNLKWTPTSAVGMGAVSTTSSLPWAQVSHIVGGWHSKKGLVRIAFLILICIRVVPSMYGIFYVHLVDFCGKRRYIWSRPPGSPPPPKGGIRHTYAAMYRYNYMFVLIYVCMCACVSVCLSVCWYVSMCVSQQGRHVIVFVSAPRSTCHCFCVCTQRYYMYT